MLTNERERLNTTEQILDTSNGNTNNVHKRKTSIKGRQLLRQTILTIYFLMLQHVPTVVL